MDEAILEAVCVKRGYIVKYKPEAIVFIKGPTKIKEFISQRRRIAYGHIWVYKNFNYLVSTREKLKSIRALLMTLECNPRFLIFVFGCIILEVIARILAIWDYYVKDYNPHYIWEIAKSSKGLINVY